MRIVVTGAVVMAHHMTCSRSFEDLSPAAVGRMAASLPIERIEVRRGGPGANIAAGLAHLGLRPALLGVVGHDFAGYADWLEDIGVDTASLHMEPGNQSARCVCITDAVGNSVSGYYAGVLREQSGVEIAPVAERLGGVDLVVLGGNDPDTLWRLAEECRSRGHRFVCAPANQAAAVGNDGLRRLVAGAEVLFVDDDHGPLLTTRTGWGKQDMLERVGALVSVVHPADLRVERAGARALEVSAPVGRESGDLIGVDDALLAGFVAGLSWGVGDLVAARVACLMGALSLETSGGQGPEFDAEYFLKRLDQAYGARTAAAVAPHLDPLALLDSAVPEAAEAEAVAEAVASEAGPGRRGIQ